MIAKQNYSAELSPCELSQMRGMDLCPRFSAPFRGHSDHVKGIFFFAQKCSHYFPLQSIEYFMLNLFTVVLTALLFMCQIYIYFIENSLVNSWNVYFFFEP